MEKKAVSTIAKHALVNFFFHGAIVFSVTGIAAIFEPVGGMLTVEINTLYDAFRLAGATGTLAGVLAAMLSVGRDSKTLNPYEIATYVWSLVGNSDRLESKNDFSNGHWSCLSSRLGLYVRREDSIMDYLLFMGGD